MYLFIKRFIKIVNNMVNQIWSLLYTHCNCIYPNGYDLCKPCLCQFSINVGTYILEINHIYFNILTSLTIVLFSLTVVDYNTCTVFLHHACKIKVIVLAVILKMYLFVLRRLRSLRSLVFIFNLLFVISSIFICLTL